MEPIVLCGAIILVFGVWIELEPTIRRALEKSSASRRVRAAILQAPRLKQKPAYSCRPTA